MDINVLFPSKYVKAADLQGQDANLVIRAVAVEDVGGDGNEPEYRPIVYFEGCTKGLLLNRTNARTIAGLYGPETDHWIGRPITLYPTETSYRGAMVACLRIRSQAPAAENLSQQPPAEPVIIPQQWSRQPSAGVRGNGAPDGPVRF